MPHTSPLTLGFLPTRRNFFSREAAVTEKNRTREALKTLFPGLRIVDIDDLTPDGLLFSDADAAAAAEKFRAGGVNAIFVPHCNFGCESAVADTLRRLRLPALLWAPRDDAPDADGIRLRDSQCGVFATSRVLRAFGIVFSHLVSCRTGDPLFASGLRTFLGAAGAVSRVLDARIGQIGVRPRDFCSVICNENELRERFGIELIPIDPSTLFREARRRLAEPDDELAAESSRLAQKIDFCATPDIVGRLAALKLAVTDWANTEALDAAAMQCWDSLQEELGVCPCAVNALFGDEGFPVACETDVHGALSQLLLGGADPDAAKPVFLADLTIRHPDNDNAELLWHCGSFPPSLLKPPAHSESHFVLPSHAPGVVAGELRPGTVSIVRFDGVGGEYRVFAGEGKIVPGPFNQGTYGYIEVDDWPAWEEIFVNGPYIHHVAGAYIRAREAVCEAARYLPDVAVDIPGGAPCR